MRTSRVCDADSSLRSRAWQQQLACCPRAQADMAAFLKEEGNEQLHSNKGAKGKRKGTKEKGKGTRLGIPKHRQRGCGGLRLGPEAAQHADRLQRV